MLFWFSDYCSCSKSGACFGFLFIVSKVTLQHAPLFWNQTSKLQSVQSDVIIASCQDAIYHHEVDIQNSCSYLRLRLRTWGDFVVRSRCFCEDSNSEPSSHLNHVASGSCLVLDRAITELFFELSSVLTSEPCRQATNSVSTFEGRLGVGHLRTL